MFELSSLLSAPRDILAVRVLNEDDFRQGNYRDGNVLRCRGIIRDVQDPELVLSGGAIPASTDGEAVRQQFVERVPLTVTLFPHTSDWATYAYYNSSKVDKLVKNDSENECNATFKGIKRSSEVVNDQVIDCIEKDQQKVNTKKSKVADEHVEVEEALVNSQAVNVYVYAGQYKDISLDAFKVNEAFEFVGILDLMVAGTDTKINDSENVLSTQQLKELQISECIDEMQRKERSGVVLHCCHVIGLQNIHHVRPHESIEFYQQIDESNETRTQFCLQEWSKLGYDTDILALRTQLVQYLAQAVHGDSLTAEYLLLALLSHVYSRADPSTPLGNLSLNLTLDKSSTEKQKTVFIHGIYKILTLLMPMVARVDLSITTLNSTKFMPHKDYERERLLSGILQAANGTMMLLNETVLSTGQLNEQGVKNLAALQSLIDKMLLPYDFRFYTMDFPQDVAIVIVSEGKSILPATVVLPVVDTDNTNTNEQPVEALLECFRLFLSVLRSFAVTIGNEEADMAEKHYVECRKSEQKVAIEDLHRWLRLARLVALSRGEGQISKNSWDAMLALETQRLSRLPTMNSK
ncbi:putative mini-chromosome maintenance complex-binding protein [Plasmopara halstedii]